MNKAARKCFKSALALDKAISNFKYTLPPLPELGKKLGLNWCELSQTIGCMKLLTEKITWLLLEEADET